MGSKEKKDTKSRIVTAPQSMCEEGRRRQEQRRKEDQLTGNEREYYLTHWDPVYNFFEENYED